MDNLETHDDTGWRLDKHIPITLIAGMLLQTIVVVSWFSSTMTEIRAELKQTSARIEEIWRDRYTKEDARRDAIVWQLQHEEFGRRIEDMERRIRQLENGYGRTRNTQ